MQIIIKYFGMLTEVTHCSEERLFVKMGAVSELLGVLYDKYPMLKDRNFQVAQDHILVSQETALSGGEVALLPPFAGG